MLLFFSSTVITIYFGHSLYISAVVGTAIKKPLFSQTFFGKSDFLH